MKEQISALMDDDLALEDAEYLLQSRPDDDPIDAKDKAQFNRLIRSIKDMHFNTTS